MDAPCRVRSGASIAGGIRGHCASVQSARFQHVELISTQGRQVLMVLVLIGGEVSQEALTLAEPVKQENSFKRPRDLTDLSGPSRR